MMKLEDAGQIPKIILHPRDIHGGGDGVHGHIKGIPQQTPGSPDDHGINEQADDRVQPPATSKKDH